MYTETVLRDKGMRLLINHLGNVEAERFITLMNREPFDYTQWQQDMFTGMSVKELSKAAMQEYSHIEESTSKG
ncbi:MAG: hypothetical protein LBL79_00700 [Prevotella sp.]|jgi:hypothetical protein|nr:hypothetical protein [Prevotella sp.]